MNEKRDIFEEVLKALERGEALESLRSRFSEEEFKEVEGVLFALANAKESVFPDKEALRVIFSEQSRYQDGNKGRVISFASIMKINWKIVAPLGAFAVLVLAFVLYNGSFPAGKNNIAEESEMILQENSEVAVFEKPLPKPTGSVDDVVAALFTDMNDELVAIERGVDNEILAAESEWEELESLNYEETQI